MDAELQEGNSQHVSIESLPRYGIVQSTFKYLKKRVFFLLECHTLPEKKIVFIDNVWTNKNDFTSIEKEFITDYFNYD